MGPGCLHGALGLLDEPSALISSARVSLLRPGPWWRGRTCLRSAQQRWALRPRRGRWPTTFLHKFV